MPIFLQLILKVKSYRGKFGLLEMDAKRSAVFYIDQVWTKTATSRDYCKFKEYYPEDMRDNIKLLQPLIEEERLSSLDVTREEDTLSSQNILFNTSVCL